jgi:hypothetical protein
MSFNLVFLASSYFLVLLGLIGLLLTRELSSPYLIVTGGSFVLAVLAEVREGKGTLPKLLANIIIVGVFSLTLFSIFILKSKTPRTQKETGLASTLPVIPL